MALSTDVEIIALFWRCDWLWYLEHKVSSSDSVPGRDLNTSCRPHRGAQVRWSAELLKIRAFVPGGARRVRFKLKVPLSCASTESRGLILDGQRRFKVMVAW